MPENKALGYTSEINIVLQCLKLNHLTTLLDHVSEIKPFNHMFKIKPLDNVPEIEQLDPV